MELWPGPCAYDEARKLSQSVGVDLEHLVREGLIKKNGSYMRLLGPKERALAGKAPASMIDTLHQAVLYWEQGEERELEEVLAGAAEPFWQVAQAIAETLPDGDKERKLLHGLLSRHDWRTEGRGLFNA